MGWGLVAVWFAPLLALKGAAFALAFAAFLAD